MTTRKLCLIVSFLFSAGLLFIGCGEEGSALPPIASAQLRVIHASPDAASLDVWVDDLRTMRDLTFAESSGFASAEAGLRTIAITPLGEQLPLVRNEIRLEPNQSYTLVLLNRATAIEQIFSIDDRRPGADSQARIRFLNAVPDAPAVSVKLNASGEKGLFSDVPFKQLTSYSEVAAGEHSCSLTTSTGEPIISFQPFKLAAGQVMTVVALGTMGSSDSFPLGARAFLDTGDGSTSEELKGTLP